jgi:hypothetical protein
MKLPKQTWQERFDEIGNKTHYSEYTDERFCCGGDYCEGDHDGFIKSFIAQILEEEISNYQRDFEQKHIASAIKAEKDRIINGIIKIQEEYGLTYPPHMDKTNLIINLIK